MDAEHGVGTAGVLLAAGVASDRLLTRWRPTLLRSGGRGKRLLGWMLLILGVFVLTGFDKVLEALAVDIVPPCCTRSSRRPCPIAGHGDPVLSRR